jgi:hypothetical protein
MARRTGTIDELAGRLDDLKAKEKAAKEKRIEAEEDLIAATKFSKEEGSETFEGGAYKVTVTAKINRKLDADIYSSMEEAIPENLRPVEWKPSLDLAGYRWLQDNEPKIFRMIAKAVTEKPGKPAVTLKRVEKVEDELDPLPF